jgi:hypothetical protein
MKIFNKIILICFLTSMPLLVIGGFIGSLIPIKTFQYSGFWTSVLLVLFILWVLCILYVGVALVASRAFREQLLKKITGIKERDEREEFIVGKAARNTFLFNLGLLIFLFILYLVQINTSVNIPSGKSSFHFALNFIPIETSHNISNDTTTSGSLYKSQFTTSGILALLIVAQIVSFYFYARRAGRARDKDSD